MFIMCVIFIWCDTCKTFQWIWELSSETCVAYLQTSLYAAGGYTGLGKNIHSCRFLSITDWFHGYSKNIPSFMILTYKQKYWGIYVSTLNDLENLQIWTNQEVPYFSIDNTHPKLMSYTSTLVLLLHLIYLSYLSNVYRACSFFV